jgi:chemotaxis protein MotB
MGISYIDKADSMETGRKSGFSVKHRFTCHDYRMIMIKRYGLLFLIGMILSGCMVSKSRFTAKELEASRLQSDLADAKKRYSELKLYAFDLKQKKKRLESQLKKNQQTGTNLKKELARYQKLASSRLAEIKNLQGKHQQLQQEYNQVVKDGHALLKTLAGQLEKSKQTVAGLEEENNRLQIRLAEEVKRHQQTVSKLENKLATLEKKRKSAQQKLEENQKLLSLRERKIQSLTEKYKQKTEKLSSKLSLSREQLADLEQEKAAYLELTQKMSREIEKGEITIKQLKGKLSLSILEKILFDSGKAEIKKAGLLILKRVSQVLGKLNNRSIRIEGHTDSDKIHGMLQSKYPTNWELSTARATNVVRFLVEKTGLDPLNIYAAGYGEFHPVAPNDTPENKSKNRRIEIVIVHREIVTVPR